MKIVFLTIGRTTDKRLAALTDDYAARLSHYVPFEMQCLPELRDTKALTEAQQKEREADLALRALQPSDRLVLLDEGGQTFTSVGFARELEKRLAGNGAKRLVFLCGGPYGFAPRIYQAAQAKVSLSLMTFSHQMVRLFFVEQLYRAMTILRGEPYHHQ